jgi:amino acid adenylation domain-containing protein
MLSESQRALLTARLRQGRQSTAHGIVRRPPGAGALPLSSGQEQLWFLDRFEPGRSTYNILCGLRIRGSLDVAALGRAVDALAARHETLRTRFVSDAGGNPRQEIGEPAAVALPLVELTSADQLQETARALWTLPFDLSQGPLMRVVLARTAPDEHVLIVVVHHIVFDGWSARVLLREIAVLYDAEVTGRAPELPELPVQFADFAMWERERLSGPVLDELIDHWRRTLAGCPNLQLPTDRPRPAVMTHEGGVERVNLGAEAAAALRAVSSQEGTTPVVVLMAAFLVLLHRYTGQDDVVVGTLSANRGRTELAGLIGYLVNTLPIRADLSGDPTFGELIAQVRDATIAAYAHQELPFAKLVEALRVDRDLSRGPVVQAVLTHVESGTDRADGADGAPAAADGVEFDDAGPLAEADSSKFELTLFTRVAAGELHLEMAFAAALFDRSTVRRMLENFGVLLADLTADVTRRVSQASMVTAAERHRELVAWNATRAEVPSGCVHEHFERRAERTPEGIAAELGTDVVTYAQLNAQANRIARRLRASGVGPEVFVGICMAPSTRRLAVVLGILKAGGAYVPLDPSLPAERLAYMAADTAMPVVVTDEAGATALPASGAAEVLPIDREWERTARLDSGNPAFPIEPSNAAYVIYTSGSTGRPKGVVVEHRQLVNHAVCAAKQWSVTPDDRVLQFASLTFDASVLDVFTALVSGARLVLGTAQTMHSPPRLAALMRERAVTIAHLPPAVLSLLTGEPFPALRAMLVGGEVFPAELARAWLRPGLRVWNVYGPTESTVIATVAEVDEAMAAPPIGLPVRNQQAYVLDSQLNPVPVGVEGELYLGGAGVARGYLNAPELTEERFRPDPFASEPGARLYKTGDLARRLPDGNIVFLGRRDGQVKIRDLRIELGEIEAALLTHPEVAQAVVVTAEDPAGQTMIVGYVRLRSEAVDQAGLRRHVTEHLPGYMVPAHLVVVDAFPLNASRKVDRRALPPVKPAEAVSVSGASDAAPATPKEQAVADIYAGLLGLPAVGVEQGFFEVGGNSLQAMQLVSRIHRELGVDIAVTAVFLAPTPRQLAARIEQARGAGVADRAAVRGPLVPLNESTGESKLFIIHAVGGTVHPYAPLAACLAGTFQVYGVEAAGLDEGTAPATSLDAMAAGYLDAIRAAQPEGPYLLAGWSMGGLVAYEIARRLEDLGQQVAQLVLLDPPFALPERTESEGLLASRFAADTAQALGWADDRPEPTSSASEQLDRVARRVAGDGGDLEAVRAQIARRFEVFKANTRMIAGYRPATMLRAPVLLVSALRSPNAAVQPDWTRLLGPDSALLRVDADHYSFLRPPLVATIADRIDPRYHPGDTMPLETSKTVEIAGVVRENLARVLADGLSPADFDPDLDLTDGYGLTSLNKVLFLMAVCDETGVGLSAFTEADVAAMGTLGDVVAALAAHAGTEDRENVG